MYPLLAPAFQGEASYFSFLYLLLRPLTVLMKQTMLVVHAIKQSIFLDVYDLYTNIALCQNAARSLR
jgi:hypothetical protein